jgi:hypothetical protein
VICRSRIGGWGLPSFVGRYPSYFSGKPVLRAIFLAHAAQVMILHLSPVSGFALLCNCPVGLRYRAGTSLSTGGVLIRVGSPTHTSLSTSGLHKHSSRIICNIIGQVWIEYEAEAPSRGHNLDTALSYNKIQGQKTTKTRETINLCRQLGWSGSSERQSERAARGRGGVVAKRD